MEMWKGCGCSVRRNRKNCVFIVNSDYCGGSVQNATGFVMHIIICKSLEYEHLP